MNLDAARDRSDRDIAWIRSDSERIAVTLEHGPLDAPIASCPGWDLRELAVHTGMVHRWAQFAIEHGRAPERGETALPGDDDDLAGWLRAGADSLAGVLTGSDPQAATWHPFPAEKEVWVWGRRQAQETAMHRWDAETAVTGASEVDPAQASEGLEEYFELGLPRVLQREEVPAPSSSLHVHCTDVDGEWLLWGDDGELHLVAEHRKGDAALRGPAATLLLVLMGRADVAELDVVGDRAVADAWLGLPGW